MNVFSHVARFKTLKPISYDIGFDNFTRCHISSTSKANTRVNCAASADVAIFFNRHGSSLMTALRPFTLLHICMGH